MKCPSILVARQRILHVLYLLSIILLQNTANTLFDTIGETKGPLLYCFILTHTSNAKCFRNVTLINIRGLAEIIVPVRGYDRHSPNQVMIKRE